MKNSILLLLLTFSMNVKAQQTTIAASSSEMNKILQSYKSQYSEKSSQYADCVLWCAMQCAISNDCKQAFFLLQYSNNLFKKYGAGIFNGRDTISEILRYDVLSKIEQNLDRDFYAIKYAKRSLRLKQLYFGGETEQTLNALLDLSQLYAERRRYRTAANIHNKGYQNYVKLLKREFCSSSESKRNAYWKVASLYVGKTLTEALKFSNKKIPVNSSMSSAAYNANLLSKGILLNTTIDFDNYVRRSNSREAKRLLDERQEISDISMQDSIDYKILNVLKTEGIEYQIPQLSIVWQDIANKLGHNDVAIEFFRTSIMEYGALIVKKGWKSPKIIKLKNRVKLGNKYYTLENVLKHTIDNIKSKIEIPSCIMWELSKAIWTDKLLLHMPEEENAKVYFSADGLLQLLCMESLPFNNPQKTRCLTISDVYNLYRLSSTRLLAINNNNVSPNENAILFGDLLYNIEDSITQGKSPKYADSCIHRNHSRGALNIDPLPYTKIEVSSIAAILKQDKSIVVDTLTQSKGSEEAFKEMSGLNHRILHIATHGYYDYDSDLLYEQNYDNSRFYFDSSMQRTGLLLAGALNSMCGEDVPGGVEDGVLTAYEIAHTNLNNLDIAVLSACETALGDITVDGVAGLQRGFKQAGTKSILMSLWKVDDEATCKLMTEFYSNWIAKKMTKHDALEAAKKAVRETKGWEDPKYWAAFILLDALD